MNAFTTLVGQYNSSLPTLLDGQTAILAIDVNGRLIQDHSTASIKVGDGTSILDVLIEDAAYAGAETGLGVFAVRNDTLSSLVTADGDFTFLQVNSDGALYTVGQGNYDEDSAHTTGDKGSFVLAVRNDTEGSLVSADGDYAPFQVDELGRLRTTAELDATPGTEIDEGSDETGTGEVGSIGISAWVDVVSIAVGAGETAYLSAVDASADQLCQFRLVLWDSAQAPGSEVIKYIRKFPVVESVGALQLLFPRVVEVAGAATYSVKLQAIRLRKGSTDANASGGINGYKI